MLTLDDSGGAFADVMLTGGGVQLSKPNKQIFAVPRGCP